MGLEMMNVSFVELVPSSSVVGVGVGQHHYYLGVFRQIEQRHQWREA